MFPVFGQAAVLLVLLTTALGQRLDDVVIQIRNGSATDTLLDIAFSLDVFKEFHSCLCRGEVDYCRASYSVINSTILSVDSIYHQGTTDYLKNSSVYYVCFHPPSLNDLLCQRAEHAPDDSTGGTQAYRLPIPECNSTCVGLVWPHANERIIFNTGELDVQQCGSTCSCPATTTIPTALPSTTTSPATSSTPPSGATSTILPTVKPTAPPSGTPATTPLATSTILSSVISTTFPSATSTSSPAATSTTSSAAISPPLPSGTSATISLATSSTLKSTASTPKTINTEAATTVSTEPATPTTPPETATRNPGSGSNNNLPIIIGVIIAVVVLIILAIVGVFLWRRRKGQKTKESDPDLTDTARLSFSDKHFKTIAECADVIKNPGYDPYVVIPSTPDTYSNLDNVDSSVPEHGYASLAIPMEGSSRYVNTSAPRFGNPGAIGLQEAAGSFANRNCTNTPYYNTHNQSQRGTDLRHTYGNISGEARNEYTYIDIADSRSANEYASIDGFNTIGTSAGSEYSTYAKID